MLESGTVGELCEPWGRLSAQHWTRQPASLSASAAGPCEPRFFCFTFFQVHAPCTAAFVSAHARYARPDARTTSGPQPHTLTLTLTLRVKRYAVSIRPTLHTGPAAETRGGLSTMRTPQTMPPNILRVKPYPTVSSSTCGAVVHMAATRQPTHTRINVLPAAPSSAPPTSGGRAPAARE